MAIPLGNLEIPAITLRKKKTRNEKGNLSVSLNPDYGESRNDEGRRYAVVTGGINTKNNIKRRALGG